MSVTLPPADVVLRDGSTVCVRAVRADDRDAVLAFLEGMSPESRRLRFFSAAADLRGAARWATSVADRRGFGIVATTGDPPSIVAHAGYERIDNDRAEVAFEVADSLRGRGLGTLLMAHLTSAARDQGIARFYADVLPENRRMLEVFQEAGFPAEIARTREGIGVELTTALSLDALERFEERERIAASAAMRHFLEPTSVAVVGASRRDGSVGAAVLGSILRSGFDGPVYPVNPHAETVAGLQAYASVADLPEAPELVVVAVRAERVAVVARDCAVRGVRGLLVLSAGFAEAGAEGALLQDELVAVCRAAGMRLVGPNCLGLMGLEGKEAVRRSAQGMSRRLRRRGLPPRGFLVQPYVTGGVEMLAGITVDPLLGPLVACAAGGTVVELIGDVSVRLAPVGRREAADMVHSLSTFPLLDGYRGARPGDVAALEDLVTRLGALAAAHPEVVELDCNPVMVLERGAVVVDARVRVALAGPRLSWPGLGAEPPAVSSSHGSGRRHGAEAAAAAAP